MFISTASLNLQLYLYQIFEQRIGIMNCKLMCLLAVFFTLMLVDTDAFRIRFRGRRVWRRIKKPLCRAGCTYACTAATAGSAAPVCGLGCSRACDRKRRSPELQMSDNNKVTIPLPREFHLYDSNADGRIQIEEFAELIGLEASRDDVIEAFSLADSDGDTLITEAELLEAPWLFENEDADLPPIDADQPE